MLIGKNTTLMTSNLKKKKKKAKKEGKKWRWEICAQWSFLCIYFCSRITFKYGYSGTKLHPKVHGLCQPNGSASRKYWGVTQTFSLTSGQLLMEEYLTYQIIHFSRPHAWLVDVICGTTFQHHFPPQYKYIYSTMTKLYQNIVDHYFLLKQKLPSARCSNT